MTNFEKALDFVLDHEGRVNEDVPGDPGGKTHWGITKADYDAYRREHGLPRHDVFQMSKDEVLAVYREHYAGPTHFDALPYPVGLVLFDTAVNVGTGRAVIWLQSVLGVTQDGGFGPKTLAAAQAYIEKHGANALADMMLVRRTNFYQSIGPQGKPLHKFLKGWLARVRDLRRAIDLK